MDAVSILTVKAKIPLYKGDDKAEKIELIQLEEVGFELVSQKDLYQVGDKLVYIQPDYCVSDTPIFEGFIRPGGDESKSYLGKIEGLPRRIRAKKFNFHRGDGLPVWSQGIGLPYHEVYSLLPEKGFGFQKDGTLETTDLTELLEITKYEAPEEKSGSGGIQGASRPFPQGMYRTDEENINNMWNHIDKHIGYPILLIGTEKIDGSSITLYYKDGKAGICSRNLDKPLTITKIVGRRKPTWKERILNWLGKDWFGYKLDLNVYDVVENDSEFVKIGKPYLDKLIEYCKSTNQNIALRGELNGKGLKGSGNKNNPSQSEEPNIKFYGIDIYNDVTVKLDDDLFSTIINQLGFQRTKRVFTKSFSSKEELLADCNIYFESNMIEGIVVRTPDSSFSAKIMNLEYDAKK